MKTRFFIFLACAALAGTSCTKDDTFASVRATQVVASEIIPQIVCQDASPLGLVEIDASCDGSLLTEWTSNVGFITATDAAVTTSVGGSFGGQSCHPDPLSRVGSSSVLYSWNASEYTADCGYLLHQSVFEGGKYFDYVNYGLVETVVNFRMRGAKGTKYIDFEDVDNWSASSNYYLEGEVVGISEVTEGIEKFFETTYKGYANYFSMFGFDPSSTYDAQYVTITLRCAQGDVPVTVSGKKRDSEIATLLSTVNLGTVVEIPAICTDKSAVSSRSLNPIHTWSVMLLIE